jgi:hypothetical protein
VGASTRRARGSVALTMSEIARRASLACSRLACSCFTGEEIGQRNSETLKKGESRKSAKLIKERTDSARIYSLAALYAARSQMAFF